MRLYFHLPVKNRTNNFNSCANGWRVYCIAAPYVSDFPRLKKPDTIVFDRSAGGYISSALSDVSARSAKFQSKQTAASIEN